MSVNTKVNGELVKSAGLYSVTKPIGMADIYSTEEKEVGLWIDNKPLYQRTLTIDTIASTLGVQRFAHNIANIETAFAISGTWLQKSDDSVYIGTKDIIRTDGSGNINVGKGSVGVWVDATNIIIDTTENRSSQYLIVTIQYTKTTDVAGSGIYVPSGDKAVHYSTDEEVIGTWIDGSTLYRKTINFGALPNATDKSVAHGISNLGYVCKASAVGHNTTNGSRIPFPMTNASNLNQQVLWWINDTSVVFRTAVDYSSTNICYVTLEYTKTS